MTVHIETDARVTIVTIDRPETRNAVDRPTAALLADAFRDFDRDPDQQIAVLTGADGTFCAGADLKAFGTERANSVSAEGDGPMGPTRMLLDKPVIAAVEGYAVAGGLELALWCDLRVMAADADFGVFCRRWGVPLIDGGTVRLPRLIGHSRALDLILTGREVGAEEALTMGLANRVVPPGTSLDAAITLARSIGTHPQACLRADRRSSYDAVVPTGRVCAARRTPRRPRRSQIARPRGRSLRRRRRPSRRTDRPGPPGGLAGTRQNSVKPRARRVDGHQIPEKANPPCPCRLTNSRPRSSRRAAPAGDASPSPPASSPSSASSASRRAASAALPAARSARIGVRSRVATGTASGSSTGRSRSNGAPAPSR